MRGEIMHSSTSPIRCTWEPKGSTDEPQTVLCNACFHFSGAKSKQIQSTQCTKACVPSCTATSVILTNREKSLTQSF
eukprot:m.2783 g.2783  ORF g.2783 m.2783 type:complete len:77 (+) comp3305_c0_seq1:59-289(+)